MEEPGSLLSAQQAKSWQPGSGAQLCPGSEPVLGRTHAACSSRGAGAALRAHPASLLQQSVLEQQRDNCPLWLGSCGLQQHEQPLPAHTPDSFCSVGISQHQTSSPVKIPSEPGKSAVKPKPLLSCSSPFFPSHREVPVSANPHPTDGSPQGGSSGRGAHRTVHSVTYC